MPHYIMTPPYCLLCKIDAKHHYSHPTYLELLRSLELGADPSPIQEFDFSSRH